MDRVSKKVRSRIMSAIRSKNTTPEVYLKKLMRKSKIPHRSHYGPKHIDVAIIRPKIAVFVDGDFWHGKNWAKLRKRLPRKYWLEKIQNNRIRDRKTNQYLVSRGWHVIRIWESELKKKPGLQVKRLLSAYKKSEGKRRG